MKAYKYLLAAAIAAVGLASAASASACEAHNPAANGTEQTALAAKSAPSNLPKALGERGPQSLRVDPETAEAAGTLEEGATYNQQPPPRSDFDHLSASSRTRNADSNFERNPR